MSQVMDNKPENRSWISPVLQESRRFRNMNIHEHANLVQSIMLNFPEIYGPTATSVATAADSPRTSSAAPSSPGFNTAEPA